MNEVIKTLLSRRSIRDFCGRPIKESELSEIIEAGRFAPNAWDNQSYIITVVRNEKVIKDLALLTQKYLGGELSEYDFFGSGCIVMVSDKRDSDTALADAGCVLENMMIAARSLGIGSVWVHQLITINDNPDVLEYVEGMGIPRDYFVCGIAALGYSDEAPEASERRSRVVYID